MTNIYLGAPPVAGYGAPSPTFQSTNQAGEVSCYLCGKTGHYARNCWAAGQGRPAQQYLPPPVTTAVDDETNEMKAYFRKKMQRQKAEEEKKVREEEGRRRREEEERREADRLREAEAREAKLEAKLLRLMSQHSRQTGNNPPPLGKKKSPTTKARMLREIRSYLDESDDESEEVKEEAERLIDAIERRKGKRRMNGEKRVPNLRVKTNRASPILIDDRPEDDVHTPPVRRGREDRGALNGEVLNFALEMHQKLSAKKVPELRKICNEEGIEWTKKDLAVNELVRCRTRLTYGESSDNVHIDER
ncbi:hypothetical protein CBR_g55825 [Chara braunii]|uniref:CCHC-type domain-containing protein n=1 Tax=Chara braunii TaxID=69332 RepID=A0A388MD84_CHABU|nr:hypothetical protein CBR_g55825 [Chara braunii]|eukprot:GBG92526.1 hypothetical protein CBR_g55825 [Chara braunii]